MHVHGALQPLVVVAEHLLQQLEAREGPPRLLRQRFQQPEFLGGEPQRALVQPRLVADKVYQQVAQADRRQSACRQRPRPRAAAPRAPAPPVRAG